MPSLYRLAATFLFIDMATHLAFATSSDSSFETVSEISLEGFLITQPDLPDKTVIHPHVKENYRNEQKKEEGLKRLEEEKRLNEEEHNKIEELRRKEELQQLKQEEQIKKEEHNREEKLKRQHIKKQKREEERKRREDEDKGDDNLHFQHKQENKEVVKEDFVPKKILKPESRNQHTFQTLKEAAQRVLEGAINSITFAFRKSEIVFEAALQDLQIQMATFEKTFLSFFKTPKQPIFRNTDQ